MTAQTLYNKYCIDPQTYQPIHAGETIPEPSTLSKMANHRVEAYIDGVDYFTAIRDEIQRLSTGTGQNRFFYTTAWWLGLSEYDWRKDGMLRINNSWDFVAEFDGFSLPRSPNTFAKRLQTMVENKVDVRVLPWVLPLAHEQRVINASGIGTVNFQTLLSVYELRQKIGNERVVLNLLGHTFGGVHCKLFVCGDENGIRAYTSGLDPVLNRLNESGLTTDRVEKSKAGEFKATDANQMKTVIDDLQKQTLSEPLYSVFQKRLAEKAKLQLPDYRSFLQGLKNKVFYYRIDLRWDRKEWNIILGISESHDEWKVFAYNIKQIDSLVIAIFKWQYGGWHDVGAKVEGEAAGLIYDFFHDLWNEQIAREPESFNINNHEITSHSRTWAGVYNRFSKPLAPNLGNQYVQVLRTIPAMNFGLNALDRGKFLVPDDFTFKFGIKGHRLKIGPRELAIPTAAYATVFAKYQRQRLSFARNGCFEFKVALQKAISAAENYIFIADQSMYCLELMDWINARLKQKPDLKVILLYGADPADPPNNFLSEAINNHLLWEQNTPFIPRDRNKQPKNIVFWEWIGPVVHCKVTIIDDVWCAIGSANAMRRSFYTDTELSISILEPPTPDDQLPVSADEEKYPVFYNKKAPSFVQKFRRDLWAHYLNVAPDDAEYSKLLNLDKILPYWNRGVWRAAIVRSGAADISLRPGISRQNLHPFPSAKVYDNDGTLIDSGVFDQIHYDRADPDSRKDF